MSWLAKFQQSDKGMTLIEVVIVMVIMGIVSLSYVYLFTAMANSTIQAQQQYLQIADAQRSSNFISSKFSNVSTGDIGLLTLLGLNISQVSMSGDQIVWKSGSNCYRMVYLSHTQPPRIDVASSSSGCSSIKPIRGPNQLVDGQYSVPMGHALYDPVLDFPESVNVFSLVDRVYLSKDYSTTITSDNQPFKATNGSGQYINIDPQASSSSNSNNWYNNILNLNSVSSVHFNFWIAGISSSPQGTSGINVSPRRFTQSAFTVNGCVLLC